MIKGPFALLLAGTLMVPLITFGFGDDRTVGIGATQSDPSQLGSTGAATYPPVPYLDTTPSNSGASASPAEPLVGPKFELGPFLARPDIPLRPFSSATPDCRMTTE